MRVIFTSTAVLRESKHRRARVRTHIYMYAAAITIKPCSRASQYPFRAPAQNYFARLYSPPLPYRVYTSAYPLFSPTVAEKKNRATARKLNGFDLAVVAVAALKDPSTRTNNDYGNNNVDLRARSR